MSRPTGWLHLWRLMVEPSGKNRIGALQPRRWCVQYNAKERSVPMAYDVACDYAELWGGKVKRYREKRCK